MFLEKLVFLTCLEVKPSVDILSHLLEHVVILGIGFMTLKLLHVTPVHNRLFPAI